MKSYLRRNPIIIILGESYLVHIGYFYTIPQQKVCTIGSPLFLFTPRAGKGKYVNSPKGQVLWAICIYYSTSNSNTQSCNMSPVPILTFDNLNNEDRIKSYRRLLKNKGGIYSFINTVNENRYIGSAKDFYLRLN